MDMHGMFYELSPLVWGGALFGVKPISQHLRMVPDFASFRGFLVLGGNQVSSIFDHNTVTGQSQAGLWFGKTDDLWSFGKPQGWGGPWLNDAVTLNVPSDPYLMTGFDKKVLHFRAEGCDTETTLLVEVDFTGSAGHVGKGMFTMPWSPYATLQASSPSCYVFHVFPEGFSAHWVRFTITAGTTSNITTWLTYT